MQPVLHTKSVGLPSRAFDHNSKKDYTAWYNILYISRLITTPSMLYLHVFQS